jgi:hypothetical protein
MTTSLSSPPPVLAAGRLVSKIWTGMFTAKEDVPRLAAFGCAWCSTCFAYQMVEHTCWTPDVAARLRADVEIDRLHQAALADDAGLGESMQRFGLALFRAVYGEDAVLPVAGPAEVDEDPARPEGA